MNKLDAMKERSRRGIMLATDVCPVPDCGCKSWVRTKAGRQLCGYCAWPDCPWDYAEASSDDSCSTATAT